MIDRLRHWTRWKAKAVDHRIERFVSTRPRLAALYFCTLDEGLSREAAAVAAGRSRYDSDTANDQASYYLLRRNIHRLEKGLIMRPRRSVFALDYLPETINVYERAMRHPQRNDEHRWATDVLTAYFEAVDPQEPVVEKARARFAVITQEHEVRSGPARVPYSRKLDVAPAVPFDRFMELSMRRRSVRWYRDEPVPRDLVDCALEAATQAPSACNRQPFVYRIFDDPEHARRLAAIPLGTKGFAEKLPAVVVLVGRLRAYPKARDRHAIYIDASLSAMAFMYALETLGLSSCPINWPDVEPQESIMAAELGLEPDERVIMLIAYGWPDPEGLVPFSAKREHDQLRIYG